MLIAIKLVEQNFFLLVIRNFEECILSKTLYYVVIYIKLLDFIAHN